MSRTHLDEVVRLKLKIEKEISKENSEEDTSEERMMDLLGTLSGIPIDINILKESQIGATISKLRKHSNPNISSSGKQLVKKWKKIATAQIEETEESPAPPAPTATAETDADSEAAAIAETGSIAEAAVANTNADAIPEDTASSMNLSNSTEIIPEQENGKQSEPTEESEKPMLEGDDINPDDYEEVEDDTPPQKPDLGFGISDSRLKVREKLFETLCIEAPKQLQPLLAKRVVAIEETIHGLFLMYSNADSKKKDYGNKVRQINFNLKKNEVLRQSVIQGDLLPEALVKMEPDDMKTEQEILEKRRIQQEKLESSRLDWDAANADKLNKQCGIKDDSGMFTCKRCKSTKTTHTQKQTRSSDEPMTVFACCLNCGYRWKFSESYF